MIKIKKSKRSRVVQGDIIKDVEYIEYATEKDGDIAISKIVFPLVVVLTQDCDLAQDYKFRWSKARIIDQDKYLMSALVAPLYNEEHIYTGEHLSFLDMKMSAISKKKSPGKSLRNNETPRYHYLEFDTSIPMVNSVIDFKHYFSVNIRYLKSHKKDNFVGQIKELYRENMSQRFSSYLSRIGLP